MYTVAYNNYWKLGTLIINYTLGVYVKTFTFYTFPFTKAIFQYDVLTLPQWWVWASVYNTGVKLAWETCKEFERKETLQSTHAKGKIGVIMSKFEIKRAPTGVTSAAVCSGCRVKAGLCDSVWGWKDRGGNKEGMKRIQSNPWRWRL